MIHKSAAKAFIFVWTVIAVRDIERFCLFCGVTCRVVVVVVVTAAVVTASDSVSIVLKNIFVPSLCLNSS